MPQAYRDKGVPDCPRDQGQFLTQHQEVPTPWAVHSSGVGKRSIPIFTCSGCPATPPPKGRLKNLSKIVFRKSEGNYRSNDLITSLKSSSLNGLVSKQSNTLFSISSGYAVMATSGVSDLSKSSRKPPPSGGWMNRHLIRGLQGA